MAIFNLCPIHFDLHLKNYAVRWEKITSITLYSRLMNHDTEMWCQYSLCCHCIISSIGRYSVLFLSTNRTQKCTESVDIFFLCSLVASTNNYYSNSCTSKHVRKLTFKGDNFAAVSHFAQFEIDFRRNIDPYGHLHLKFIKEILGVNTKTTNIARIIRTEQNISLYI